MGRGSTPFSSQSRSTAPHPAHPPDQGYLRPGPGVPGPLFGHGHAEDGHLGLTFSLRPVLTASCHLEAHCQDRRRESLSRGLSFCSYI